MVTLEVFHYTRMRKQQKRVSFVSEFAALRLET